MRSEHFLILIYVLNNLRLSVSSPPKWSVATDEKCVFTVSKNWTILFEQNPSLFVTYLKEKTAERCRSACCAHQTCNGYVFDSSDQADSCKLLKCSRNGTDCKKALIKYAKDTPGEVGFITGLAGAAANSQSSQSTDRSPTSTQTPNGIHGNHENAPLGGKDEPETKHEGKENPIQGVIDDSATTREHVALPDADMSSTTSTPEKSLNFTEYANNQFTTNQYREDIKEHTNSISLTIAFLFGIGFLVTVFYLTGRRWLEGFKEGQQKGYTRISYLLNGV